MKKRMPKPICWSNFLGNIALKETYTEGKLHSVSKLNFDDQDVENEAADWQNQAYIKRALIKSRRPKSLTG